MLEARRPKDPLINAAHAAEEMYCRRGLDFSYLLGHGDRWIYMSPRAAAGKEKMLTAPFDKLRAGRI
jgi:hypothetical protein